MFKWLKNLFSSTPVTVEAKVTIQEESIQLEEVKAEVSVAPTPKPRKPKTPKAVVADPIPDAVTNEKPFVADAEIPKAKKKRYYKPKAKKDVDAPKTEAKPRSERR